MPRGSAGSLYFFWQFMLYVVDCVIQLKASLILCIFVSESWL